MGFDLCSIPDFQKIIPMEVVYQKVLGGTAAGTVHRFLCSLWIRGVMYQSALDLIVLENGGIERYAPRKLVLNHTDYTIPATNTATNLLHKMLDRTTENVSL